MLVGSPLRRLGAASLDSVRLPEIHDLDGLAARKHDALHVVGLFCRCCQVLSSSSLYGRGIGYPARNLRPRLRTPRSTDRAPWCSATGRSGLRSMPAASSSTPSTRPGPAVERGCSRGQHASASSTTRATRTSTCASRWTTSPSWSTVAGGRSPSSSIPGEFVLGQTLERVTLPDDLVAPPRGQVQPRPARAPDPLHRRLRGQRLLRATSRSSCRTWPTCPSRSTRGCRSGRSPSCGWTAPSSIPTGRADRIKYQGQAEPTPSRFYLNFEDRSPATVARRRYHELSAT